MSCQVINCCDLTPFSYHIPALAARVRVWIAADPDEGGFISWEASSAVLRNAVEAIVASGAPVTVVARARGQGENVRVQEEGGPALIIGEYGLVNLTEENPSVSSSWQFDGWYNGDTLVSTEANYTFNPSENITLTAKFSPL